MVAATQQKRLPVEFTGFYWVFGVMSYTLNSWFCNWAFDLIRYGNPVKLGKIQDQSPSIRFIEWNEMKRLDQVKTKDDDERLRLSISWLASAEKKKNERTANHQHEPYFFFYQKIKPSFDRFLGCFFLKNPVNSMGSLFCWIEATMERIYLVLLGFDIESSQKPNYKNQEFSV